jgi:hypothetical protein
MAQLFDGLYVGGQGGRVEVLARELVHCPRSVARGRDRTKRGSRKPVSGWVNRTGQPKYYFVVLDDGECVARGGSAPRRLPLCAASSRRYPAAGRMHVPGVGSVIVTARPEPDPEPSDTDPNGSTQSSAANCATVVR